jgi:hypothetical protein
MVILRVKAGRSSSRRLRRRTPRVPGLSVRGFGLNAKVLFYLVYRCNLQDGPSAGGVQLEMAFESSCWV